MPPPIPEAAELLRVDQAAVVLQLPLNRIYKMVKDGSLPSERIGRHIRLPRGRLMALIGAAERKGRLA